MNPFIKHNIAKIIIGMIGIIFVSSCEKKLDLFPTNASTSEVVYKDVAGYKQSLAKVYASMALVGPNGPGGTGDLPSEIITDAGSSDFMRNFWYLQSLSTDEAGWTFSSNTDPIGIHQMAWNSGNFTVKCMYYRSLYTVTICNNLIQESSDANLSKRNITGADATSVKDFKEEARLVRAYQYWVMMDLFGNPPFATESTPIGSLTFPPQISRKDLFTYLEKELKELETTLKDPRSNEYGRVDKAAAWALLARLYLNAEVYAGTPRYTDAITYCNKIINAGYSLVSDYKYLMLADNQLNTNEFIWALRYDGITAQNYGGTTFLVHGPAGYSEDSSGLNGTWNCIRFTQQFVDLFPAEDIRGQFWTSGQNKIMTQLLNVPTDGYSSSKFRNKTRSGALAPNLDVKKTFSSIDMPLFRLADIYLIYAEAILRGGTGGNATTALKYLQDLAKRARPSDANAGNAVQFNLQYILDERGRELFWEGYRRTDLIRYNQFTTNSYLWAWKGGVFSGTAVDAKYNLFPLPIEDITANPNLKQNTGY